nr:cell division regulator GpsB [Marinococcus halotolerans]
MLMEQTQLSAKDILDKDFKNSVKGYNKDEVDQFLDIIIQDYERFEQKVRELEDQLNRSPEQRTAASPEGDSRYQRTVTSSISTRSESGAGSTDTASNTTAAEPAAGTTNYDILKRLSNLEKEVFGKKLYD